MSGSRNKKSEADANRVQVTNLPQQERELKDQEAENVKGGGGLSGGVIQVQHIENVPQQGRN